ncbi:MAG: UDP-glucose 4-epimerase GalE [Dongiaceae bacterium]
MHILVTGGAGYIGSHTCKALAAAGFTPVTYDNLSEGHRWSVKWGPLEQGELADGARLAAVIERWAPAAVIHFAASIAAGESVVDPGKFFRNNTAGSLSLLETLRDRGPKVLVFSSTAAVYGTPQSDPIPEDHPLLPINPYGASKLMVERMIEDFGAAHGLRYARLRYFNAAGADPEGEIGEAHEPETHAIPLALLTALGRREAFHLFGTDYDTPDGSAIRDYIHVADLAAAHVLALRRLLEGGDNLTLNLGTGEGHSVLALIAAVERVTGRSLPVRRSPRRAGDPPRLVADPRRAQRLLGWRPALPSLDAIVASAWRWHRGRNA